MGDQNRLRERSGGLVQQEMQNTLRANNAPRKAPAYLRPIIIAVVIIGLAFLIAWPSVIRMISLPDEPSARLLTSIDELKRIRSDIELYKQKHGGKRPNNLQLAWKKDPLLSKQESEGRRALRRLHGFSYFPDAQGQNPLVICYLGGFGPSHAEYVAWLTDDGHVYVGKSWIWRRWRLE